MIGARQPDTLEQLSPFSTLAQQNSSFLHLGVAQFQPSRPCAGSIRRALTGVQLDPYQSVAASSAAGPP